MRDKTLPVLFEGIKRILEIVQQKLTIPFFRDADGIGPGSGVVIRDHRERVVRRRLTGGLDRCAQKIVDQGGFAR